MPYKAPENGFRTFVILWLSQSVSVFGSALTYFAINIWLVQSVYPLPEQKPELAWALAAMGICFALPTIAVTPIAGALADRLDRKKLMLAGDLANALLMALLAVLMAAGLLKVWMVLVGAAVLAMISAIHNVAFDTSYAMLVPDEQLPRANGMMQTMWALSSVLSPAAAALLISLPALARQGTLPAAIAPTLGAIKEGAAMAIAVDAATFLAVAIVLLFMQIPSPKREDLTGAAKPSIWADVRFGATYIRRRPPLLWLLGTFAVVNLCLPMGVFLPLIVKVDLSASWSGLGYSYETALALLNTVLSIGGIAGGVLVSVWGGLKRRRVVGLMLSMAVGGAAQVWLGLSGALYAAAAAGFLLSFTGPFSNAHSQAIWQGQVPRELQGRVFSVRRVIAQGLGPLGQVLAGVLAARLEPGVGFALLGGVITVVTVAQLFNPVVHRVEDKAYLDNLARSSA